MKILPVLILVVALAGSLLASQRVVSAFPHDDGWLYEAIDRLKTLGVMPLWAGTVRPITRAHLLEAVEIATRRAETVRLSSRDLALLDRLRAAAGPQRLSMHADPGPTRFAISRLSRTLTGETGRFEWLLGFSTDGLSAAGAYFSLGPVGLFIGRSPIGWGPAPEGGLLFAESAPGLDRIEVFIPWRNVRLTKFVGALDGSRSIVATRLDILRTPTFRVSLAESVIMSGAPYYGYLLNPVPLLVSQYLEQQLRPLSGDNQNESVEIEWVIRPGLRLFGELLVDDFTVPTAGIYFPSRIGLIVGFHRAFDAGDLRVLYSAVSNYTYTQDPGNYLLRGIPLGHPLGNDFDVLHIRWTPSLDAPRYWGSVIRKGEGRIGIPFPPSDTEAWRTWFLRGIVEYSAVAGVDVQLGSLLGWGGTIGPWVAYRTNAGHVTGVTRMDWGINFVAGKSF